MIQKRRKNAPDPSQHNEKFKRSSDKTKKRIFYYHLFLSSKDRKNPNERSRLPRYYFDLINPRKSGI